jgi:CRP/FNR family transcriptional regulator, cyclic AMP receptor protein
MSAVLTTLHGHPVRHFAAGETVLDQGDSTGLLFILIEGSVEVVKDGVQVTTSAEPGAIFGDLAALLRAPHTAAVRTLLPSSFYVLTDPRGFFRENPLLCVHLCELLARRLDAVTKYLVDVKRQFQGNDHLGMMDEVLDTLLHRQPRPRVTPRASTLRDPEIPD